MSVIYRPAREDELAAAQILTAASINDLTQRHGFGTIATARPAAFQAFSLRDDPDGLWIAEQDGRMVGSVFGWCCERLWFLAELFIAPDLQGQGIGQGLLSRALAHADTCNADVRALIALAFNTTSQALYIRHGFFPRMPIYLFSAKREALRADTAARKLDSVALATEHLPALADIDRDVLEEAIQADVSREADVVRLFDELADREAGEKLVHASQEEGRVDGVRDPLIAVRVAIGLREHRLAISRDDDGSGETIGIFQTLQIRAELLKPRQ